MLKKQILVNAFRLICERKPCKHLALSDNKYTCDDTEMYKICLNRRMNELITKYNDNTRQK